MDVIGGFTALFGIFGEGGAEAFRTFLASPAPWILAASVAVVWLLRRR